MDDVSLRTLSDALLEQLPIGVILTDRNGDIMLVNRRAEIIRGVKREDLLHANIRSCHKETSLNNVERALQVLISKPDTVYRRMVDDQANGKYYINTYAGVSDQDHQPLGVAVMTEDVTEKRKLELERATAYRIMQETEESLKSRYHDLLMVSLESINLLLEKRDPYTSNHSANVCRNALKMYEWRYGVGIDYDSLKIAAVLHDIGKIGIPDEVLNKQGKLTDEEFNIIKEHCVIAEEILRPLDTGSSISRIVRHHHEHYDGSGYPDGLAGEAIPELSRIIAVADAYDAMRSNRPYRKAMDLEHCISEFQKGAGKQFDPYWAGVLIELSNTGSL